MKTSSKLALLLITGSFLVCSPKAHADIFIWYETVLQNLSPIKIESAIVVNNTGVDSTGNTLSGTLSQPRIVSGSSLVAPWSTKFDTIISTNDSVNYNFTNVTIPAHSSVWVSCWFDTETGHETFNWAPSPDADFAFITRNRIWNTASGTAFLEFGS